MSIHKRSCRRQPCEHWVGGRRRPVRLGTLMARRAPVYPNVAKAGGIQSQGAKGAAVVIFCSAYGLVQVLEWRYVDAVPAPWLEHRTISKLAIATSTLL